MTAFDKEKAAFTVGSSESGTREQVLNGLVSVLSIPEAAQPVKGREGFCESRARRLAAMLTEGQQRDVIRLAMAIVSNLDT